MGKKQIFKGSRLKFPLNQLKLLGVILLLGMTLFFMYNLFSLFRDRVFAHEQTSHSYKHLDEDLIRRGFNDGSCQSKYDPLLHGKSTLRSPSSYLVSKLRSYEERHKNCAPYTSLYNKTVDILRSNMTNNMPSECKYIVWFSADGLGNRMISLPAAFLYALLTDRIFLIYPGDIISDLFCEPFPEGSWLLPLDFPLMDKFEGFKKASPDSFGELLKHNHFDKSSSSFIPYVYAHLWATNYDDLDKSIFCDEALSYLRDVPWLLMMTNIYFIPSLYSIPHFEQELQKLFPDRATIFHLLGRYLFHPKNSAWELVRRFYDTYLSDADLKVGIQVRLYFYEHITLDSMVDQVVSCGMNEGLLPQVDKQGYGKGSFNKTMIKKKKKIAVVITSLNRGYFEHVRSLYWENPTITGEIVGIHQACFDKHQQTGDQDHDKKALAEIYLLSLMDSLLTSERSTFGYAAQGLGGLVPWMVYKTPNETGHYQPCRRLLSMEPCFHIPLNFDCSLKRKTNTSVVEPYIKPCEDWPIGVKLVDNRTMNS